MSITPSPGTPAERVKRSLRGRPPRSTVSREATPVRADWRAVGASLSRLTSEAVHRVDDFVHVLVDERDRYPLWDLAEPFTYAGPLWTGHGEAARRLLHVRAVVALGGEMSREALDALVYYGEHLGMTDDEILSVLSPLIRASTGERGLTWTRS